MLRRAKRVLQQERLVGRAGGRRLVRQPAIEHEHAQRDMTQKGAGGGELDDAALPTVGLDLADVVQQRAGKDQLGVGAAGQRGGAPDARHLDCVAKQTSKLRVMTDGAGRTVFICCAKCRLVVKQGEGLAKASGAEGAAVAIEHRWCTSMSAFTRAPTGATHGSPHSLTVGPPRSGAGMGSGRGSG
jgi:hypothetical protein